MTIKIVLAKNIQIRPVFFNNWTLVNNQMKLNKEQTESEELTTILKSTIKEIMSVINEAVVTNKTMYDLPDILTSYFRKVQQSTLPDTADCRVWLNRSNGQKLITIPKDTSIVSGDLVRVTKLKSEIKL